MGKISDARALDPCLTPVCRVLLHTGFPPSSAWIPIRHLSLANPEATSRKNHAMRHSRYRTGERSCLLRDTVLDGSKNGGVCFTGETGNRMELADRWHRCQNLQKTSGYFLEQYIGGETNLSRRDFGVGAFHFFAQCTGYLAHPFKNTPP